MTYISHNNIQSGKICYAKYFSTIYLDMAHLEINDLKHFMHIMLVYTDLVKLRDVEPNYKFVSASNIRQYYRYIINILKQYQYYHDASIAIAAAYEHVSVLECKYSAYAMDNGYVHVLEWFRVHDLEMIYTTYAIDKAGGKGRIDVLEWFRVHDLEMKYTAAAIDRVTFTYMY